MALPVLQEIRIYPIKSLGCIRLQEAVAEERGFRYDRRWMLVVPDPNGGPWQFVTQRTVFPMALLDVALTETTLQVWHRHRPEDGLEIPLTLESEETLLATVWDDTMPVRTVSAEADRWFSRTLGFPCRLVRMPDSTRREADSRYARPGDVVSFADGYPFLLIGQASLDELNGRLTEPVAMARFRPNLVVSGSLPYAEDAWSRFIIGDLPFRGVKPCARCVLTTIHPETGERGQEPLKTLAAYRTFNRKVLFGQNVIPDATGLVRVGDAVRVLEEKVMVPGSKATA